MSQSTTEFVNGLYDQSAELGNTMNMIYLVIAIIIGVISVICAIINFASSPQPTIIQVGSEIKTTTSDPMATGSVSLVLAILVVGISYLNYYISTHSKAYASMEGMRTFSKLF